MKIIITFILVVLSFTNHSFAKDLAVLLYVPDTQYGDNIYQKYTKDLGLSRKLESKKGYNFEYHVTLGYISNVEESDQEKLKNYILDNMADEFDDTIFEFSCAVLLGKGNPYIVALPKNIKLFTDYNKLLHTLVSQFYEGKYRMKKIAQPENFIPHLSLNGKVHEQVKIEDLPYVINTLNTRMKNSRIKLSKLVIN